MSSSSVWRMVARARTKNVNNGERNAELVMSLRRIVTLVCNISMVTRRTYKEHVAFTSFKPSVREKKAKLDKNG